MHPEPCSDTEGAGDGYFTAERVADTFNNSEAKPNAAVFLRVLMADLLERLDQVRLTAFGDTRTGIVDVLNELPVFIDKVDQNAACFGELDGVADQIEQDLTCFPRIAAQR